MATNRAAPRTAASRPTLAAYVLHAWDWSDSSLIVELFSRAAGRVVVVAKGAKKPTSNLRALLLPFQPLALQLGALPRARPGTAEDEGGSDFHPLKSAEWAGGAPLLGAAAMLPAYYLNELLLRLLPRHDPHPVLFDAYSQALAALAGEPDDAATLRAFELKLLRELGWLPDLTLATLAGTPLAPTARYTLAPEAGLVADREGPRGEHWLALEAALAAPALAALRDAAARSEPELRAPLRGLVHYHLGHSRLRTRELLQGVQRLAGAGALAAAIPTRPARGHAPSR